MSDMQKLKAEVRADGRIDEEEVVRLRRELYADGVIDRSEVNLLVDLRQQAAAVCPAFEDLFFQAVKDHLLADGSLDADEAAWLREVLTADGVIDDREK